MITILVCLYLIGYLITYIMLKNWREETDDNSWGDIIVTVLLSLFSWIGVIWILIVRWEKIFGNKFPEPPNWL